MGRWLRGNPAYEVRHLISSCATFGGFISYPKMKLLCAISLAFSLVNIAEAKDQMRDWSFESREKQEAEIIAFEVIVHAFEGGQQMPPPSLITKAFLWLLETKLPAQASL